MRKLACVSTAIAALLLPSIAPAQVTSVFTRIGAVTAQSGDYTCTLVTGCLSNSLANGSIFVGNASNLAVAKPLSGDCTLANTGAITCTKSNGAAFGGAAFRTVSDAGAGDLCALQQQCVWTGQTSSGGGIANRASGTWNTQTLTGVVNPKVNAILQLVGAPADPVGDPEVNAVDAFAYGGEIIFAGERYDWNGSAITAVGANEPVSFLSGAPFDGSSDPAAGIFGFYTTEAQQHSPSHNGTAAVMAITLNGSSTLRNVAMCWSGGGLGGVTVGDYGGAFPANCGTDPGIGSVATQNDVVVGNHLRSNGSKPTLSACGTGGSVVAGTDNAGLVTVGAAVTSCTVNFAKTPFSAICVVTMKSNTSPSMDIDSTSTTNFIVKFSAAYSGSFYYICQGWQ